MISNPVFALLLALAVPPVPEGERARLDGGEVIVKPRTPSDDEGFAVLR